MIVKYLHDKMIKEDINVQEINKVNEELMMIETLMGNTYTIETTSIIKIQ